MLLGLGLSAAGTGAGPHLVALAALARLVLAYTRFGYGVYAVGGNPEAARLSGLGVDRITLAVYVITGGWAGSSSPPA